MDVGEEGNRINDRNSTDDSMITMNSAIEGEAAGQCTDGTNGKKKEVCNAWDGSYLLYGWLYVQISYRLHASACARKDAWFMHYVAHYALKCILCNKRHAV